eukprot:s821_g13.t1
MAPFRRAFCDRRRMGQGKMAAMVSGAMVEDMMGLLQIWSFFNHTCRAQGAPLPSPLPSVSPAPSGAHGAEQVSKQNTAHGAYEHPRRWTSEKQDRR